MIDASTMTDNGWLPRCVTYYKGVRRNSCNLYIGCEQQIYNGTKDIIPIPQTVKETFVKTGQGGSSALPAASLPTSASDHLVLTTSFASGPSSVLPLPTPTKTLSQDPSASFTTPEGAETELNTRRETTSNIPTITGGVVEVAAVVMLGYVSSSGSSFGENDLRVPRGCGCHHRGRCGAQA
ncbi:hypothetical protein CTA1_9587 [Colletotrichum tanaceti]|uniref:Uncharacterized protein n=1 Tax=Colletotrichum tanaceti TaxID=1306861 RepID=A0A4U6XP30_9PEZI|nr:hypothetical protein CTA1_9587 [Colletotrichum tanaceti]